MTLHDYFLAFVPIFVAVDALGMLPIFMGLTAGMPPAAKRKLVGDSTATALAVALVFLWIGRQVFSWLGVTISDFLVAGGAILFILFILSIRDLLSYSKKTALPDQNLGVVPLAVPLIVGPGVLTTSMILQGSFGILPTVVSVVINILLCGVVLRFSETLSRVLGETGSQTLSKIFNLLLGAIGVMMMRRGILEILSGWAGRG